MKSKIFSYIFLINIAAVIVIGVIINDIPKGNSNSFELELKTEIDYCVEKGGVPVKGHGFLGVEFLKNCVFSYK